MACDDSHLPVVQAGNLRILVFSELRRLNPLEWLRLLCANPSDAVTVRLFGPLESFTIMRRVSVGGVGEDGRIGV